MTVNLFAFYPYAYGHLVWKEPIVQCKDHSTHKINFPWLEIKKKDYISSEVEIFFDLAILASKGFLKSPPLRGRGGGQGGMGRLVCSWFKILGLQKYHLPLQTTFIEIARPLYTSHFYHSDVKLMFDTLN